MLTKKEYEVLELVAQGLSNKVIAARLWVQQTTVKQHLVNIYKKLNIDESFNQRVAAVIYFLAMEKSTSNGVGEKGS